MLTSSLSHSLGPGGDIAAAISLSLIRRVTCPTTSFNVFFNLYFISAQATSPLSRYISLEIYSAVEYIYYISAIAAACQEFFSLSLSTKRKVPLESEGKKIVGRRRYYQIINNIEN